MPASKLERNGQADTEEAHLVFGKRVRKAIQHFSHTSCSRFKLCRKWEQLTMHVQLFLSSRDCFSLVMLLSASKYLRACLLPRACARCCSLPSMHAFAVDSQSKSRMLEKFSRVRYWCAEGRQVKRCFRSLMGTVAAQGYVYGLGRVHVYESVEMVARSSHRLGIRSMCIRIWHPDCHVALVLQ